MSVPAIGDQDGIQALKRGLLAKGVVGAAGASNIEHTLETLKAGHNENVTKVAAVEQEVTELRARLDALPFLRPPAAT